MILKKKYQNLLDNNVKIIREPKEEPCGTVTVFEDLYGNMWNLFEQKKWELKVLKKVVIVK